MTVLTAVEKNVSCSFEKLQEEAGFSCAQSNLLSYLTNSDINRNTTSHSKTFQSQGRTVLNSTERSQLKDVKYFVQPTDSNIWDKLQYHIW